MPTNAVDLSNAKRFFDELQSGEVMVGQQQAALTGFSGKMAYEVGVHFLNRHWQIYAAPPILISCDEPVMPIGGPGTRRGQRAGFATAGVVVMPLAPNALLAMFRDDLHPVAPWALTHGEVAELNREILAATSRWAFERPSRHFTERVKVPPASQQVGVDEFELTNADQKRRLIRTYRPNRWAHADAPGWPIRRWWKHQ